MERVKETPWLHGELFDWHLLAGCSFRFSKLLTIFLEVRWEVLLLKPMRVRPSGLYDTLAVKFSAIVLAFRCFNVCESILLCFARRFLHSCKRCWFRGHARATSFPKKRFISNCATISMTLARIQEAMHHLPSRCAIIYFRA